MPRKIKILSKYCCLLPLADGGNRTQAVCSARQCCYITSRQSELHFFSYKPNNLFRLVNLLHQFTWWENLFESVPDFDFPRRQFLSHFLRLDIWSDEEEVDATKRERESVWVFVFVCVWEREREREREFPFSDLLIWNKDTSGGSTVSIFLHLTNSN